MADDFCAGRAAARAPAIDFCHCHVPKALTAPCTGETSPAKGALPTKRNCRCSHELPKGPDLVPLSDQLLSQLVALWGTHLPSAPLQTQLLADPPWCSMELSAQELLTPASSTPLRERALPYLRAGPAAWQWMDPSTSSTVDPAQGLQLGGSLALLGATAGTR